jgi:cephalosporin-C deacetylase
MRSRDVTTRPADFDAYWEQVDSALALQPMRPVLERIPAHCSEYFDGYGVHLTSVGPYRIFGFFSVPRGAGPFPALLEVPRYGSVNNPPHWNDRRRYVVLTLMHRGQRYADQPFAAAYPGLLTLGLEDPQRYVFRGIVADCWRGAEFLSRRAEVDPQRIALRGNDLGLLTAARRPYFKSALVEAPFLYGAAEARRRSDSYPLEELNDYVRSTPEAEAKMVETLDFFDPLHHAPAVRATTMFATGDNSGLDDEASLEPLMQAVGGPVEQHALTFRGRRDGDWFDAWLARQLDVEPMSRWHGTSP